MMKSKWSWSSGVCLAVLLFVAQGGAGRAQEARAAAKLLHTLGAYGAPLWLSPDGRTLAFKGADVELYDVATGTLKAKVPVTPALTPKGVFFTPDGKALVVHTDRVQVVDASDGKVLREFAEGSTPINFYRRIYTGREETSYDESSGGYSTTYVGPSDKETLLELPALDPSDRVVSPDWKSILVRREDGAAEVYDFETGKPKFTLSPKLGPDEKVGLLFYALGEFSPDGKLILTSHASRTPRLWNAATGELVADLAPHSQPVYGARFSPDGKFIVTTSVDGVVKTWDGATGKFLHAFGSAQDPTYFAAWNPRGDTFVTKSRKWEVDIWGAATGKLVARLDRKAIKEKFDNNFTFAYSPDGRRLLTRARNVDTVLSVLKSTVLLSPRRSKTRRIAHLWDAATGKLVASMLDTKPRALADYPTGAFLWSPSSRFLVSAGPTVKLWRANGELVQELEGNAMLGATLSRDGRLLVAGHLPDYPFNLKVILKAMVGKLPKEMPLKTHIWQIDEDAVTVSANK